MCSYSRNFNLALGFADAGVCASKSSEDSLESITSGIETKEFVIPPGVCVRLTVERTQRDVTVLRSSLQV